MISVTLNTWWRRHATLRTLYLLFLGQVVSFALALLSFFSSLIATLGNYNPILHYILIFRIFSFFLFFFFLIHFSVFPVGVDAPLSQSLFIYFNLGLIYGGILLSRRQHLQVFNICLLWKKVSSLY